MKSLLNLVGISHSPGSSSIVPHLKDRQPLTLIPEPDNPFDSNAIAVYIRLGYVKKEQAAKLAPKLKNEPYPARIVTVHSNYAEMEIDEPPTVDPIDEPFTLEDESEGPDHPGEPK